MTDSKNRRSSQVLLNRKFHSGCRFCHQHSPRQWSHPFIYLPRSFRLLLCFVFLLEILRKSLPLNSFVGKCKFSTVCKGYIKGAPYPKRNHLSYLSWLSRTPTSRGSQVPAKWWEEMLVRANTSTKVVVFGPPSLRICALSSVCNLNAILKPLHLYYC